jgi:uncharacterized membrane protein
LGHAFVIGVWLKGINGTLELIGGFLLLLIPAALFQRLICHLAQHDLGETLKDFIFRKLSLTVEHLTGPEKSFVVL